TTAVFTPSASLAAGSHAITATFTSADTTRFGGSSTTQPASLTITAAATQTALAAGSPNPAGYGPPPKFQVTPSAGVPTGVVQFTDQATGANLGTADLVNGLATMPITALAAKKTSYQIIATYQGDGNFLSSANATPVQQTVNPATTSITVATPSLTISKVVVGNPVTLTAVVSAGAPSQAPPTGTGRVQGGGPNVGAPRPGGPTRHAT